MKLAWWHLAMDSESLMAGGRWRIDNLSLQVGLPACWHSATVSFFCLTRTKHSSCDYLYEMLLVVLLMLELTAQPVAITGSSRAKNRILCCPCARVCVSSFLSTTRLLSCSLSTLSVLYTLSFSLLK